MILEAAPLQVKPDQTTEFEKTFKQAQEIIQAMPGYVSHQLQRCLEDGNKYLLLVNWQSLEDHTEGFRNSEPYQQWKALLHHFYEPSPTVEHFEPVYINGAIQ